MGLEKCLSLKYFQPLSTGFRIQKSKKEYGNTHRTFYYNFQVNSNNKNPVVCPVGTCAGHITPRECCNWYQTPTEQHLSAAEAGLD